MSPSPSPDARRTLVVAYDIADDRRRARVAKTLGDFGVRVQLSVFECALTRGRLRELRRALERRIDPAVDSVSFYLLCRGCNARIRRLGRPPPSPDAQYLIF